LPVISGRKPPSARGIRKEPYGEFLKEEVDLETGFLQRSGQPGQYCNQPRNLGDYVWNRIRVIDGIHAANEVGDQEKYINIVHAIAITHPDGAER
jgi:hypothetical protein